MVKELDGYRENGEIIIKIKGNKGMGKREELMVTLEDAGEQLFLYTKLKAAYTAVEEVPLWEAGGRVIAEEVVAKEISPPLTVPLWTDLPCACSIQKQLSPPPLPSLTQWRPAPLQQKKSCRRPPSKFSRAPLYQRDAIVWLKGRSQRKSGGNYYYHWPQRGNGEGVLQGEDIAVGEKLIPCGSLLEPSHLAILATLGYATVKVYGRPKIVFFHR